MCPEAGSDTLKPIKQVFSLPVHNTAGMLAPPQHLFHCSLTGSREGLSPFCNLIELVAS